MSKQINITLSPYQRELLDYIYSSLNITPHIPDNGSDPLINALYVTRRILYRSGRRGDAPSTDRIVAETLFTGALLAVTTALNEGEPVGTNSPPFTGDYDATSHHLSNKQLSLILAHQLTNLLDAAIQRATINRGSSD
jgi:hypothetical protein